jgi:hypothetical protein
MLTPLLAMQTRNRHSAESKGSAFVWYSTCTEAAQAVLALHSRYAFPDARGEHVRLVTVRPAIKTRLPRGVYVHGYGPDAMYGISAGAAAPLGYEAQYGQPGASVPRPDHLLVRDTPMRLEQQAWPVAPPTLSAPSLVMGCGGHNTLSGSHDVLLGGQASRTDDHAALGGGHSGPLSVASADGKMAGDLSGAAKWMMHGNAAASDLEGVHELLSRAIAKLQLSGSS